MCLKFRLLEAKRIKHTTPPLPPTSVRDLLAPLFGGGLMREGPSSASRPSDLQGAEGAMRVVLASYRAMVPS